MSEQLVAAAQVLLDARESQMITRLEWEALAKAVADATSVLDEMKVYEGDLEAWSNVCLAAANPWRSLCGFESYASAPLDDGGDPALS
jgi:hypothetical protein